MDEERKMTGSRELTEIELAELNEVTALGEQVGGLIEQLQDDPSIDGRWLSIARTQLQQGFMALTRAIAKPTTFALAGLLLAGCVSPYKEAAGTYIKTAHTEFRSPFGTNDSFAKLQRCQGPTYVVLFYTEGDFTECRDLPVEEAFLWQHGYSQGQGGQILEGAMNAGALGALAATKAGGSAAASASAVAVQSVTVTAGKHGRR